MDIYNDLVKKIDLTNDSSLLSVIELDLLETAHALRLKFDKWIWNKKFQKEFKAYVKMNIKKYGHFGLPSSFDFISKNVDLYNLLEDFSKESIFPKQKEIKEISVYKEHFSFILHFYVIKANMMKKNVNIEKIKSEKKLFKELEQVFSEKEIIKIQSKLNMHKGKIIKLIDNQALMKEFYRDSMVNCISNFELKYFYYLFYQDSYYINANNFCHLYLVLR
jgi:hypothetical protein